MDKVVVIGGAGLVGASVTRVLVDRGDDVTVFDSGVAAGFRYLSGLPVRVLPGDIRDMRAVWHALEGCASVVHLAAQPSVPASISDPVHDFRVNVEGSLNVLEAARLAGVRRFVFASSNSVVAGHDPPTHERLVPKPVSPYGAGKAAIEAYLRAYGAAYDLETVALRFSNVYGPWSGHKTSVVATFVRSYVGGGPLRINGSGRQTRDFVFVRDIARGVVKALDAPAAGVAGETFQLGTGRETALLTLAEMLFEVGGRRVEIEHRSPSAGDVPRNASDISEARRVLGYEPETGLHDGLRETLAWFRADAAQRKTER